MTEGQRREYTIILRAVAPTLVYSGDKTGMIQESETLNTNPILPALLVPLHTRTRFQKRVPRYADPTTLLYVS